MELSDETVQQLTRVLEKLDSKSEGEIKSIKELL